MQRSWKYIYYITTVLVSVGMLMGAYSELTNDANSLAVLMHLGYPAYFGVMLGVAKVLGVIGIWQRVVPFLREWAYAGFFFDVIAAGVSWLAIGQPTEAAFSVVFFVLLVLSYVGMRKQSALAS